MGVADGPHGQCSVTVLVEQDSHAVGIATDIHFAAPTAMAHSRFYVDRRLTRNTKSAAVNLAADPFPSLLDRSRDLLSKASAQSSAGCGCGTGGATCRRDRRRNQCSGSSFNGGGVHDR